MTGFLLNGIKQYEGGNWEIFYWIIQNYKHKLVPRHFDLNFTKYIKFGFCRGGLKTRVGLRAAVDVLESNRLQLQVLAEQEEVQIVVAESGSWGTKDIHSSGKFVNIDENLN